MTSRSTLSDSISSSHVPPSNLQELNNGNLPSYNKGNPFSKFPSSSRQTISPDNPSPIGNRMHVSLRTPGYSFKKTSIPRWANASKIDACIRVIEFKKVYINLTVSGHDLSEITWKQPNAFSAILSGNRLPPSIIKRAKNG